jgi:hypothetical protein
VMKRYHTGGEGEAMAVLRRRLNVLQREAGYRGYSILEYSEGIDSQTLGARRYADGLIQLTGKIPRPVPVAPAPVATLPPAQNSFMEPVATEATAQPVSN